MDIQKPVFDYYYGDESNQFSFYRIPRQLITGADFRRVSTDAKLLYGLLLDRMGLSAKNGWYDKLGRVYIYYTLDEIQKDINCGHEKAVKLLAELDSGKGCGLIERKKQGQGRPTIIYVKRFTTRTVPPIPQEPETPRNQDFGKAEVQTSEKQKSRLRKPGSADFGESDGSYIKSIQTNLIQTDPSIYPPPTDRLMDRDDCRKEIERRIEYAFLCTQFGTEDVSEVVELLVDAVCSTRSTLRIGGEEVPVDHVRNRLWSLTSAHLEYVFDCMHRNTTQVHNIRAYLLTALYNAPVTINSYYQAEVQHDFGL